MSLETIYSFSENLFINVNPLGKGEGCDHLFFFEADMMSISGNNPFQQEKKRTVFLFKGKEQQEQIAEFFRLEDEPPPEFHDALDKVVEVFNKAIEQLVYLKKVKGCTDSTLLNQIGFFPEFCRELQALIDKRNTKIPNKERKIPQIQSQPLINTFFPQQFLFSYHYLLASDTQTTKRGMKNFFEADPSALLVTRGMPEIMLSCTEDCVYNLSDQKLTDETVRLAQELDLTASIFPNCRTFTLYPPYLKFFDLIADIDLICNAGILRSAEISFKAKNIFYSFAIRHLPNNEWAIYIPFPCPLFLRIAPMDFQEILDVLSIAPEKIEFTSILPLKSNVNY